MVSVSVGRGGWLFVAVAVGADNVVSVQQESLADERSAALVARETAAVPVATLERHVARTFRAET